MTLSRGALYTVNKVPTYNIYEETVNWWLVVHKTRVIKKCFQFSCWATMQPIRLTADGSTSVERRQKMIGRPGLIDWQLDLLWLTSAGDSGPRPQLPGNTEPSSCSCESVNNIYKGNFRDNVRKAWFSAFLVACHMVRYCSSSSRRRYWKMMMCLCCQ